MQAKCWWVAAVLALPGLLAAQSASGSSGGTLSERAQYIAFYRGRPPDGKTDVLLILRAQPGWASGYGSGSGRGRSSMGPASFDGRGPINYSLEVGAVKFECSFQPDGRILRFGGESYLLDSANVVIIDRVDGVGGAAAIVRRLTLLLPPAGRKDFARTLRQFPELREFL